jgi:hypothetical protein
MLDDNIVPDEVVFGRQLFLKKHFTGNSLKIFFLFFKNLFLNQHIKTIKINK